MKSELRFNKLRLLVRLGWGDDERRIPQPVDVSFILSFKTPPRACATDHLDETVCYSRLSDVIRETAESKSFNLIVCRAAFKNFTEPVQALNEMHRVLTAGGKALIYDLRPDAPADAINAEVKGMGLGWLNALLTRLTFKYLLLRTAYSQEEFTQMVSQSAFGNCEVRADGIGLAVSLVKDD